MFADGRDHVSCQSNVKLNQIKTHLTQKQMMPDCAICDFKRITVVTVLTYTTYLSCCCAKFTSDKHTRSDLFSFSKPQQETPASCERLLASKPRQQCACAFYLCNFYLFIVLEQIEHNAPPNKVMLIK